MLRWLLACIMALALVGCVTTKTTLPTGEVIETTALQAEQVQAIGALAGKIYDYYTEMKLAEAQNDQAKAAEKKEMAVELVELLKSYKVDRDVVVPVPEELLNAEGK